MDVEKVLCYVDAHWSRPLDIACRFRPLASSRAKEQFSLVQLTIISTDRLDLHCFLLAQPSMVVVEG